jgi:DNA-binding NarL/FixJ family response regulator
VSEPSWGSSEVRAPIRVVIIEDHPLFRDALAARLREVLRDVTIAYSGASISEALDVHRLRPVSCAVLDLDLGDGQSPVMNTAVLIKAGVPVLVVSAIADPATVTGSLAAGALGFVSKQATPDEFKLAVESVIEGEPYTSSDVVAILSSGPAPSVSLSERERTALVLYASGMKLDSVARKMGIKTGTAGEYIKRVREKYLRAGVPAPTKTDLYRRAREDGILP